LAPTTTSQTLIFLIVSLLSLARFSFSIVDETRKIVQQYYGKELQTSADLQTNACCTGDKPPPHIQECLAALHPITLSKYYGCGLCLPDYDLRGLRVLDLGCGAGRDVYIASQLVGPSGAVVGIDMTVEQLDAAREYQSYHAEKFGFSNVQFLQGYLEELDGIPELQPGSFDLIVSNCVLNLCTDKFSVLQSCFNLLKPGGEMYFSDVYASRRVPESLRVDPVLWGECLSGALYWNDFENMAVRAGFDDPRLVEDAPITIANATVQATIDDSGNAGVQFYSATYRLWKLPDVLEPACEDYGQAVVYKGTIPRAASKWKLDKGHIFEAGRMFPVCGNTWNMLTTSPLKDHFHFYGDFTKHYGIFEGCGSSLPYDSGTGNRAISSAGGCC
jgi:arsenite methyltransferase